MKRGQNGLQYGSRRKKSMTLRWRCRRKQWKQRTQPSHPPTRTETTGECVLSCHCCLLPIENHAQLDLPKSKFCNSANPVIWHKFTLWECHILPCDVSTRYNISPLRSWQDLGKITLSYLARQKGSMQDGGKL